MSSPARSVAWNVLVRVDEGAYVSPLLAHALSGSRLDERDRAFVTALVYGVLRRRRGCDWLVDRYLRRPVETGVRSALRLGAFQLAFMGTPAHAAVATSVELVSPPARGLVNAVLRKVAQDVPVEWPDAGTELGYPDWMVRKMSEDLGAETALASLVAMDAGSPTSQRADGYLQDAASQWVADSVPVQAGSLVVDMCAGPGGKATAMASRGANVVALELHPRRAAAVAEAAARLGTTRVVVVAGDARRPPLRPGVADAVLLDAPCSGLGALRRRPDARWRLDPGAPKRLASLQKQLTDAAVSMLKPGGVLVYSVCTLSKEETLGVDEHLKSAHPDLLPLDLPAGSWDPLGRGALLLPQAEGTDGMFLLRARRS